MTNDVGRGKTASILGTIKQVQIRSVNSICSTTYKATEVNIRIVSNSVNGYMVLCVS